MKENESIGKDFEILPLDTRRRIRDSILKEFREFFGTDIHDIFLAQ